MALTIKEALEKRGQVEARIDEVLDRVDDAGNLTAEDEQQYDSLLNESKSLKAHADRLQAREDVRSDLDQIRDDAKSHGVRVPDQDVQDTAVIGWLKANCKGSSGFEVSAAEKKAAKECGISLSDKNFTLPLMSVREAQNAYASYLAGVNGLSRQVGEDGGFFVSETMISALEVAMLAHGGVLQVADIIRTAKAGDLTWPTFDDTANSGSRINEGKTVGTATSLKFGKTKWGAFKYTSDALKVTYETLRDVEMDLPRLIGEAFGERLGRKMNVDFTTGSGGQEPEGIVTGAVSSGVTTASATAITFDELIDLEHSIDPALRTQGCQWMFNDATAKLLRKIKDGDGHYIWERSVLAGVPDTLFAYPVRINVNMAGPVSSAKSVLFGLLSKYKVRQVGQVRSYRATELYLLDEADGFVSFIEADGGVLNPASAAASAPIKHLTQKA